MTPERKKKLEDLHARRFSDLCIILENVDDPHNLGAILRSCDAVGVGEVHLVYTKGKPPRMRELRSNAAASAAKWLSITTWDSVSACVGKIRAQGKQILVTSLAVKGKPQWEYDLRGSTAIVVGNEHEGVSSEFFEVAAGIITIPMRGMVESLNVSVAAAVILEEALRQRLTS